MISIDCGAIVDGWHGDAAITVAVGEVPPDVLELMRVTEESMWAGFAAARLGGRVTDISHAVEAYVRSQGDYGILEDYTGHGIGTAMHQPPNVPNYGRPGRGPKLERGLALAVEPMVTLGSTTDRPLEDDWTVVTADGQLGGPLRAHLHAHRPTAPGCSPPSTAARPSSPPRRAVAQQRHPGRMRFHTHRPRRLGLPTHRPRGSAGGGAMGRTAPSGTVMWTLPSWRTTRAASRRLRRRAAGRRSTRRMNVRWLAPSAFARPAACLTTRGCGPRPCQESSMISWNVSCLGSRPTRRGRRVPGRPGPRGPRRCRAARVAGQARGHRHPQRSLMAGIQRLCAAALVKGRLQRRGRPASSRRTGTSGVETGGEVECGVGRADVAAICLMSRAALSSIARNCVDGARRRTQ